MLMNTKTSSLPPMTPEEEEKLRELRASCKSRAEREQLDAMVARETLRWNEQHPVTVTEGLSGNWSVSPIQPPKDSLRVRDGVTIIGQMSAKISMKARKPPFVK